MAHFRFATAAAFRRDDEVSRLADFRKAFGQFPFATVNPGDSIQFGLNRSPQIWTAALRFGLCIGAEENRRVREPAEIVRDTRRDHVTSLSSLGRLSTGQVSDTGVIPSL